MQEFTVFKNYGKYDNCTMLRCHYENDHIAIMLYCEDGPLATITTNIEGIENYPVNYSCVDTNNCPWAPELIAQLGIGERIGSVLRSGYCTYPVYAFNYDRIEQYTNIGKLNGKV